MKNKDIKKIQQNYVKNNIEFFIELLEKRFNPNFDKFYVKEINRLSEGFNIRLRREQKLKFCKQCDCFWDVNSVRIRLNSKKRTKEYTCKKCDFIKRFVY